MFWKPPTTRSTSYYYSREELFEKSLDVVQPLNDEPQGPVVILVVGSGWVGHRAFVYNGTSWWNSSGPKTIARLGYTCVCVRHRGAFCVLPQADVLAQYLVLLFALLGALTNGKWEIAVGVTALVTAVLALLALGGRGSASLEDMWNDVTEAVAWIDRHPELLKAQAREGKAITMDTVPPRSTLSTGKSDSLSESDTSESGETSEVGLPPTPPRRLEHMLFWCGMSQSPTVTRPRTTRPLIFGGYSSGGHVAATLLQQPERFQTHGLPVPQDLFQGILMISGMMALRPAHIAVHGTNIATPRNAPTWLTNWVMNLVWGTERAEALPSPLTMGNPPHLPHLLLGCRNEVFGLNWLDVFFSGKAFAEMVQAVTGQSAKYVQVESDHWNVLNSTALSKALETELPKLVMEADVTAKKAQ